MKRRRINDLCVAIMAISGGGIIISRLVTHSGPTLDLISSSLALAMLVAGVWMHTLNTKLSQRLRKKQDELIRVRFMLDALPANVVLLDEKARVVEANESSNELAGVKSPGGTKGDRTENYFDAIKECVGPDEKDEFSDSLKKILAGEINYFSTVYPCQSEDDKRWYKTVGVRKLDDEHSGTVLMQTDVTHLYTPGKKIRDTQANLHLLVNLVPHVIFARDEAGKLILANKRFMELYGIDIQTPVSGRYLNDLIPRWKFGINHTGTFDFGPAHPPAETKFTDVEGVTRFFLNTQVPYIRIGHEQKAFLCISTEVTEQKRSSLELRNAEENYREIFNKVGNGIIIVDAESDCIVNVNQRTLEITGYRSQDLINKHPGYILPIDMEAARSLVNEKMKRTLVEGDQEFEWQIRHNDGSFHWVEVTCSSAQITGVKCIIVSFHLIDERKRMEEMKAKITADLGRRNADLQRFAFLVSHVLRAPVSSILGLSNLLNENISLEEIVRVNRYLNKTAMELDDVVKNLNSILETSRYPEQVQKSEEDALKDSSEGPGMYSAMC